MANAFTKKYLTDLIDSRLAALEDPDSALSTDERQLAQMYRENIEYGAELLVQSTEKALQALRDSIKVHAEMDTQSSLRQVQHASSVITTLRIEQKYAYHETQPLSDRISKARRQGAGPNIEVEKARLERVKNYITESPDDEFSVSLMRTLGFIDIIKQAING